MTIKRLYLKIGEINTELEFKGKKSSVTLVIIEQNNRLPLLGREIME